MKAKLTTAPIIPSLKGNREVSQDGADWLEGSQGSEWPSLSPLNATSVCPPQLRYALRATNVGGTHAAEVGFLLSALHVGGLVCSAFDVVRTSSGSTCAPAV